jgi:hypothetical protein
MPDCRGDDSFSVAQNAPQQRHGLTRKQDRAECQVRQCGPNGLFLSLMSDLEEWGGAFDEDAMATNRHSEINSAHHPAVE